MAGKTGVRDALGLLAWSLQGHGVPPQAFALRGRPVAASAHGHASPQRDKAERERERLTPCVMDCFLGGRLHKVQFVVAKMVVCLLASLSTKIKRGPFLPPSRWQSVQRFPRLKRGGAGAV